MAFLCGCRSTQAMPPLLLVPGQPKSHQRKFLYDFQDICSAFEMQICRKRVVQWLSYYQRESGCAKLVMMVMIMMMMKDWFRVEFNDM